MEFLCQGRFATESDKTLSMDYLTEHCLIKMEDAIAVKRCPAIIIAKNNIADFVHASGDLKRNRYAVDLHRSVYKFYDKAIPIYILHDLEKKPNALFVTELHSYEMPLRKVRDYFYITWNKSKA